MDKAIRLSVEKTCFHIDASVAGESSGAAINIDQDNCFSERFD